MYKDSTKEYNVILLLLMPTLARRPNNKKKPYKIGDAAWACRSRICNTQLPKFYKNTRLAGKIIEKTSLTNFY